MIVADTNLILYLVLDTERTAAAEAVLERDPTWCAPPLWESECRNALVLYVRKGLLTLDGALGVVEAARGVLGERVSDVATGDVMDTAITHGLSAYDAEFVVLAEALGVPLVTDDRRVLKACPHVAVSVDDFARGASDAEDAPDRPGGRA